MSVDKNYNVNMYFKIWVVRICVVLTVCIECREAKHLVL